MTDLSPAAQAVAWAYDNAPERPTGNHRYHWIAAALRAVADGCDPNWLALTVLHHLHSIADELEAQ
jgi:hypothetical protein